MAAGHGVGGVVAVHQHDDRQQDQDGGQALVQAQEDGQGHDDGAQEDDFHGEGHHALGLIVLFLALDAGDDLGGHEQGAHHRAHQQGDREDDPAAGLLSGQVAGEVVKVVLREAGDGQAVQDDLGQAAPEQHAGQGDDEGGYAHVGDPEGLPHADGQAHQQADDDGQVDVHLHIDDKGAGHRAHQGHHGAHRQVDVAAGEDAHQHTHGQDDHVAVLADEVCDVGGGQQGLSDRLAAHKDDEQLKEHHHRHQGHHHGVLFQHPRHSLERGLLLHFGRHTATSPLPALDLRIQDMMDSWLASSRVSSPTTAPSFIT